MANFAELKPPHLVALVCVIATYWLYRRIQHQRSRRAVHSRYMRHLLPAEPPAKGTTRLIELGMGERQYLRMGVDHASALKIFLVASLRLTAQNNLSHLIRKVERGLEHVQRLHPMLRVRVVRHGGELVLEEDGQLRIPVRVRVDQAYGEVFTKEGERRHMPVGLHAESPHACWLFVKSPSSQEEEQQVEIALDLAHFAFDGSGLGPLMHEFLSAVFVEEDDKPAVAYSAWPEPQEVAVERTVEASLPYFARTWQWIKALLVPFQIVLRETTHQLPRDDSAESRAALTAKFHTMCLAECFSKEETQLLLQRCRDNKTSLTAAVSAAVAEAAGKHFSVQGEFSVPMVFVADSRGLCDAPAPPATDLAPHVLAMPMYYTEKRKWNDKTTVATATASGAWDEARRMRQYMMSVVADSSFCRFYALHVPRFLALQPIHMGVPVVNVSSWSAKSPVQHQYGGQAVKVERVELLQNFSASSWLSLSMYTMVDRLTVSFFAPVPRFDEDMVRTIFADSIARLRQMLEKEEQQ